MSKQHPLVLAVTGASGAIYAVRLLQQLLLAEEKIHFVMSESAGIVLRQELGIDFGGKPITSQAALHALLGFRVDVSNGLLPDLGAKEKKAWEGPYDPWPIIDEGTREEMASRVVVHNVHDFMTPIASGSFRTRGMIICPCSGTTMSGLVHAQGRDLIQRAADVHLKEHRKLILVPRETPLSVFQLENMQRAASAGAVVLPAMPGWYHGVRSIVDLVDFVVARILDHLEVEHALMRRWGEAPVGNCEEDAS